MEDISIYIEFRLIVSVEILEMNIYVPVLLSANLQDSIYMDQLYV